MQKNNRLLNNHQYHIAARKGMLLIAFLLGIVLQCAGQNLHRGIELSFEQDSITGLNVGDNFSNKLTICNNGTNTVTLIKIPNDSMALIALPDTVQLAADECQAFFTKYFASVALLREFKNKVTAAYRVLGSNVIINTSFALVLKSAQHLSIESLSSAVYINEQTNTAHIDLRCTNNGFSNEGFKLSLKSYPDGLSVTDNNREIHLAQGVQQVISIDARNTLPQSLTPDYGVSVQAIDAGGKVIASLYIQVLLLGSSKRIALNGSSESRMLNNSAQLSYWYTNAGYSYAQMYLKGNLNLTGNDNLKYNINVNEYTKPTQGTEIYDSRIEYQGQHFALQAGSISENLDFSLYGNGVKASFLPDAKNTISAYYVDNGYFLYSSINRQVLGGKIWAASYDLHPSVSENIKVNFLHGTSPQTGVQTNLANTDMKFSLGKNNYWKLKAA